jgi:hypothetical protein
MAQVLVPLQRLDRRAARTIANEIPSFDDIPAFADFDFDDPASAKALAPPPPPPPELAESFAPPPAPPELEPEPPPRIVRPLTGRSYITVTDAAGRVLFRRPATEAEVDDAMRAAEEAEREGSEAMDRIAHERLAAELADFDGEPGS